MSEVLQFYSDNSCGCRMLGGSLSEASLLSLMRQASGLDVISGVRNVGTRCLARHNVATSIALASGDDTT